MASFGFNRRASLKSTGCPRQQSFLPSLGLFFIWGLSTFSMENNHYFEASLFDFPPFHLVKINTVIRVGWGWVRGDCWGKLHHSPANFISRFSSLSFPGILGDNNVNQQRQENGQMMASVADTESSRVPFPRIGADVRLEMDFPPRNYFHRRAHHRRSMAKLRRFEREVVLNATSTPRLQVAAPPLDAVTRLPSSKKPTRVDDGVHSPSSDGKLRGIMAESHFIWLGMGLLILSSNYEICLWIHERIMVRFDNLDWRWSS